MKPTFRWVISGANSFSISEGLAGAASDGSIDSSTAESSASARISIHIWDRSFLISATDFCWAVSYGYTLA